MTPPRFILVDPSLKDFVGHHFEYDAATAQGAAAHGFEVVCLAHRNVLPAVEAELPLTRAFTYDMWGQPAARSADRRVRLANDAFVSDLTAAAARPGASGRPLGEPDVVFGHMITRDQLHGWGRFAAGFAGRAGPQIVLLLRYQPSLYDGPWGERGFAALEAAAARGVRVRLASDSARLARQLERLTTLPVEVFPIPHTTRLSLVVGVGTKRAGGPLRVVSLGNARDEKGLLDLFDAARLLALRGEGDRFAFHLQVNDPTPELMPAIDHFARSAPPGVALYREPLSSAAYYDLLKSADIVALPYWRSIYEARTSGVFMEALAAGKPVLCTADTWMSDQLQTAGAGVETPDRNGAALAQALSRAADGYPALLAKADAGRPAWLAAHNPDAFIRVLLGGDASGQARSASRHVAVLYPWGDALQRGSGASLRVNLMTDFLAEHADRVRLLEDAQHADVVRGKVSYEAVALLGPNERRPFFRALAWLLGHLPGARGNDALYALLHLYPLFDPTFRKRVFEIVRWADVVFCEYAFWAPVVASAARRYGKPWVLTAHDVVSDQIRGSRVLRAMTRWLERRGMAVAPHRVIVGPADAETFRAWGVPGLVIPSAIDRTTLIERLPVAGRPLLNRLCGLEETDDAPLFLFVGSRFGPNIAGAVAVREIAEAFDQAYPDLPAHFIVAGACHDPLEAGRFRALGFVEALTLRLLYEACSAVLAPLTLGTGVSLKAFEALAAGAPLVATRIGIRGVGADQADGVLIEDELDDWPDLLADLLAHPDRTADLRRRAAGFGETLDYHQVFRPYLSFAPALAEAGAAPPSAATKLSQQADRWMAAAGLAERHRLPSQAGALVRSVLDADPENVAALSMQARLVAAGSPERGLSALEAVLGAGGDPVDVFRARADLLAEEDRQAEAQAALQTAAAFATSQVVTPEREGLLRKAVWEGYQAGERVWTRAVTGEVARYWPSVSARVEGDYHYLFAVTEAERTGGDLALALHHAEAAAADGYNRFWAGRLIADIGLKSGEPAEAVVERALGGLASAGTADERRMTVDAAMEAVWTLFREERRAEALALARRVAAAAPRTASAWYLVAECVRILEGDLVEASRAYERARVLGFDAGWCLAHRGRLIFRLGRWREAMEVLLTALRAAETPSPQAVALDGLREVLWSRYQAGEIVQASAALTAALGLAPADPSLIYLHAESLKLQGRPMEAAHAYSQAAACGYDPYWCHSRRVEVIAEARGASLISSTEIETRLLAAAFAQDPTERRRLLDPALGGPGEAKRGERLAERLNDLVRTHAIGEGDGHDLARLVQDLVAEPSDSMASPSPASSKPAPKPASQAVIARAWRQFGAQDYEAALATADRAARLGEGERLRQPDDPEAAKAGAGAPYLVAECLQILDRDPDRADQAYGEALALGFDPFWVHFNRAQLRAKGGDLEASVHDLQAALAAAGDKDRRTKAQASLDDKLAKRTEPAPKAAA